MGFAIAGIVILIIIINFCKDDGKLDENKASSWGLLYYWKNNLSEREKEAFQKVGLNADDFTVYEIRLTERYAVTDKGILVWTESWNARFITYDMIENITEQKCSDEFRNLVVTYYMNGQKQVAKLPEPNGCALVLRDKMIVHVRRANA